MLAICEETQKVHKQKWSYNHIFKNKSDYLIKIFKIHSEK